MKEEAENDPPLRVLVFDLEQVLETPLLSTGAAFYLKQLSTFNLTVYDTTTKITHCYMWCEVDGNRGANEIASCLYYHCLDSVPDTVKKIVLFSDSTTGQNRNSILAAMFLTLVQVHASVASVEHVFLEVGHTRMEYPSCKFAVVEMKREFHDFQALLKGPLVLRQITTTKEKFSWMTTPLLRADANRPGTVSFKRNLQEVRFLCLDFQRSGKAGEHSAGHLQRYLKRCHHLQPLPISKEKKADLIKLLPLIPSSAHEFYNSIPTHAGNESDQATSSEEIEESEED
ncbi:Adenine deaminase [Frankliniella fusca]|uniref:Adenine deaminase n=1 Tax=Frankliniella fusca TaxID=407009 RepID=A0AAE1LME9_9NEOP|nr:Adenine deaminase [Frankliniella fusca]KAK3924800.1 Adenine deaminase [Frankliniella fusca]